VFFFKVYSSGSSPTFLEQRPLNHYALPRYEVAHEFAKDLSGRLSCGTAGLHELLP
jgi:hypothetical protein